MSNLWSRKSNDFKRSVNKALKSFPLPTHFPIFLTFSNCNVEYYSLSEIRIDIEKKNFFFSIWVLFHEHSRITGLQGKGKGIPLTPHYPFHPLHRHLDISRAITAESSPLRIASSRALTGNLWFPRASRLPLSYAPIVKGSRYLNAHYPFKYFR